MNYRALEILEGENFIHWKILEGESFAELSLMKQWCGESAGSSLVTYFIVLIDVGKIWLIEHNLSNSPKFPNPNFPTYGILQPNFQYLQILFVRINV